MKPFAIYFPQFYPTPTNDAAWGRGFTDWSLVANANMRGLWARRAPRRGYYDGSSHAVHLSQIQEMRSFGLGGLALYHYWFYTQQELDAFENTLLSSDASQVQPWFLVWACEGWSRRWLGDPSTVVSLTPSPSDTEIERHCDRLATCFSHAAYMRLSGRPLFVWYHLHHFASAASVVDRYRQALDRRGFDALMGHFVKNPFDAQHAAIVDFSYLFEPRLFFGMQRVGRGSRSKRAYELFKRVAGDGLAQKSLMLLDRFQQRGRTYAAQDHLRYLHSVERRQFVDAIGGHVQEVLSPGWNNAPRYGERFTALGDVPETAFAELVHAPTRSELPLLINAWNEWSEGAAIEPCAYLGTRYLNGLGSVRHSAAAPLGERAIESL
jgi:hypothetical protein